MDLAHIGRDPKVLGGKTPIGSLPDELLYKVFRLVQLLRFPERWWDLLRVCRRWSALGRTAALLWSDIAIGSKQNEYSFVMESLEYSRNTPLTIYIYNRCDFTLSLSLLKLSDHIGRIQSLIIVDDSNNHNLATFLGQTFPALRTLEGRSSVEGRVESPLKLAWRLLLSHSCRLHHLSLGGLFSFQVLPDAAFPSLRKLDLNNDRNPCFTLPQFVQFLSRHLHLEELSLMQFSPKPDSLQKTLDFPTTIKHFVFQDSASYVKRFLSSFKFIPSRVYLAITRHHSPSDRTTINAPISCILPDSPHQSLRTVSRVTSIEFAGRPGHHYSITGRAQPHETTTLINLTGYIALSGGVAPVLYPLNDVAGLFRCAPVTELRLQGPMVNAQFPREQWMAFLDAFPLLAHVSIEPDAIGEGTADARMGLFEALRVSDVAGGARWPHLKRFTLLCGDWMGSDGPFFLVHLPNLLKVRSEQGAKVSELHFFYKHEVWTPEEGNAVTTWTIKNATWSGLVDHIRIDFVS